MLLRHIAHVRRLWLVWLVLGVMDTGSRRQVSYLDALQERLERDGEAALTWPERYFLAVEELETQLMTGGTEEYLLSATREATERVLAALAAIGALRTRELLVALKKMQESLPDGTVPNVESSASRSELFARFIKQLEEYPDHLRSLREVYAARNDKEFLGPRKEKELWLSRRQRGAQTAPRRISVVVDVEAERQRDALVSSRSCPECGYPSPDYRRTCKECGFPHGTASPG